MKLIFFVVPFLIFHPVKKCLSFFDILNITYYIRKQLILNKCKTFILTRHQRQQIFIIKRCCLLFGGLYCLFKIAPLDNFKGAKYFCGFNKNTHSLKPVKNKKQTKNFIYFFN